MLLALDTCYRDKAVTAAILFENWFDQQPSSVVIDSIASSEPYVPGEFYRKELPCIHSMLEKIYGSLERIEGITAIIVDSYVFIDDDGTPGMGAHLYHSLNGAFPVIGVAKSQFINVDSLQRKIYRGESSNHLHISSIGMDLDLAAKVVLSMHGPHRLPTLLKLVDHYTRNPGAYK